MFDLLKIIANQIPRDSDNSGGFGPFRLPEEAAAWMSEIFEYHDRYYDIGPTLTPPMPLSEIDWRIFRALTIKAESAETDIERCHRAHDICRYWPVMRSVGHYLYGRYKLTPEELAKLHPELQSS